MFRYERNTSLLHFLSYICLSMSIAVVKLKPKELFGFVLTKSTKRRVLMGDIITMDFRNNFK